MEFTGKFLEALANWQKGWREDQTKRKELADELKKQCKDLPSKYTTANKSCFRKRFLHRGELIEIIMNDENIEGVTSWTTDEKFAERFKGIYRKDAVTAAIFKHHPLDSEVIVNIVSLWQCDFFKKAADQFKENNPEKAKALFHFKDSQGEVILETLLKGSEIIAMAGVSSPFDDICDQAGTPEDERDEIFKQLIDSGVYIGEPTFIPKGSASEVIANVYNEMKDILEQHGVYLNDKYQMKK